jgi:acyl-CoA thioesterase-1
MLSAQLLVFGVCALSGVACNPGAGSADLGDGPAPAADRQAELAASPDAPRARPRVVVLGDSLTAGLGLDPDLAYPALLQHRLDAADLDYEVVNAGVSGDTSAGGMRRVDWALDGDVRVLIVALGGNDALRGLPVDDLRRNLAGIIERAQARGISVILAGMEAPPNFGPDYTVSFRNVYTDLATQYQVALVPFLLDGVAGLADMNQRDGIHPSAEGARRVADNVWSVLQPIAERRRGRGAVASQGSPGP